MIRKEIVTPDDIEAARHKVRSRAHLATLGGRTARTEAELEEVVAALIAAGRVQDYEPASHGPAEEEATPDAEPLGVALAGKYPINAPQGIDWDTLSPEEKRLSLIEMVKDLDPNALLLFSPMAREVVWGDRGSVVSDRVHDVFRGPWRVPTDEEVTARIAAVAAAAGDAEAAADAAANTPPAAPVAESQAEAGKAGAVSTDESTETEQSAEQNTESDAEQTPEGADLPLDLPGRKHFLNAGVLTLDMVRAIPTEALPSTPGITTGIAGKVLAYLAKNPPAQ